MYHTFLGNWCDAMKVGTQSTSESKPLCLLFCGEENFPLLFGGVNLVRFLFLDGKALRIKRGLFGSRKKIQPLLCGVSLYAQDMVATGMVSGHVYLWKERKVMRSIVAHVGSVYAINTAQLGLITGGKDGLAKIWDRGFNCTRQFSMNEVDPLPFYPPIHSVCCNRDFTKLVVGMRGGEIFEVTIKSGKKTLITECHSKKQCYGLAANPAEKDEYATVGDDGVLRVWSLSQKKVIRRLKVDGSSRAIAWSEDGELLALGFGGASGDVNITSKDGAFMILSKKLEVLHEDRKAKQNITDLKFSRNGLLLAVASEDGKVYIHDRDKNWALLGASEKANDFVRWLDFSFDGEVVQAGTKQGHLVLYRGDSAAVVKSTKEYKDMDWYTMSCPFGWYVQGIWPREHSTDFKPLSVARSPDRKYLAVSFEDGEIRMFMYPCQSQPDKKWLVAKGHAKHATKVAFSSNGEYLLSLDGYSGAVLEYELLPVQEDARGKKTINVE